MEILILNLLVFIIVLVGLAGNAFVLYLLGFQMQRNPFSVYILNLAGADFIFLCCQVVYFLYTLITFFHSISTSVPFFNVMFFFYITGLSILSTISTEHCLSTLCPIWYHCHRPKHTSPAMRAFLWALSLLLSFLKGNYCRLLFSDFDYDWCQAFDLITSSWLMFLFIVLFVSNLALLVRMLCSSWRIQLTNFYIVILITVFIFLLCGLPLGIQWSIGVWIQHDYYVSSYFLNWIMDILPSVNSSVKPIIYFFVGSFRQQQQQSQTLKLLIQRALEDIPGRRRSGESLPQETMEILKAVSHSDSVSVRAQSEK
ncbi:LOW QUALITY PROTEIN: mas-related G-protein coupled receptor member X2-like [Orycteropus afer afer]|uniref:LOW QUALITY PROTEIN: mas-related G-protein coupled receptor member X2-like n=1 Tax=Orycteropus afer afer TaxID=1230840 RepID=A0A8B7B4H7_ORYAF|nr:LOW QUALITY PROTEIN: mas-related G-protein coupled receptor member X2-like [Orycteropus afer afer]